MGNTGLSGTTVSNFQNDRAQAFTTGSVTGGYQLTGVTLMLWDAGTQPPIYQVSVHSDSSGPGTSLGTLTTSDSLGTSAVKAVSFTPSSPIDLDADTKYWVVMDVTTPRSGQMGLTSNKGQDGGAAGWTIANSVLERNHTPPGNWATRTAFVVRMALHGIAKTAPEFQSAEVDGTTLTLAFSEDLDSGSKPAASDFTVKVNGTAQTPTGVAISGSTVTLTLRTAVTAGQSVTVSYAIPSSNPLQHAGRRVAGFSDRTVVNLLGQAKLVGNTGQSYNTNITISSKDFQQAFTTGVAFQFRWCGFRIR